MVSFISSYLPEVETARLVKGQRTPADGESIKEDITPFIALMRKMPYDSPLNIPFAVTLADSSACLPPRYPLAYSVIPQGEIRRDTPRSQSIEIYTLFRL